jgi:hypothetical protein
MFVRPVEPGAGQKVHRAAIEARMHAVAVELDFVQPVRPIRRLVDELGELWLDPLRQTGRSGARTGVLPAALCRERRTMTVSAHAPPAYPSATARRALTVSAAS